MPKKSPPSPPPPPLTRTVWVVKELRTHSARGLTKHPTLQKAEADLNSRHSGPTVRYEIEQMEEIIRYDKGELD